MILLANSVLKNGVYFYTIQAGDFFTATRKMVIGR